MCLGVLVVKNLLVLIAFNKPYGVLSQFTSDGSPNRPLAEFGFPKNVYAIGRLDADSEGLLLLSDEAKWNDQLLNPRHAHEREYWAQVEKIPTRESLNKLQANPAIGNALAETDGRHAWLLEPQPEVSTDVAADVSRLQNIFSQSGLTSAATIKIPAAVPAGVLGRAGFCDLG